MIVLLSDRSILSTGLAARLAETGREVVSAPLASGIRPLARLLTRLEPSILVLDASDMRGAGFLFLDALREQPALSSCPILILAGGAVPNADGFREAAEKRGYHIALDAITFDELVSRVERIVDRRPLEQATAAS